MALEGLLGVFRAQGPGRCLQTSVPGLTLSPKRDRPHISHLKSGPQGRQGTHWPRSLMGGCGTSGTQAPGP